VPDPFMTALDCADPSLNVGRRTETLTALQSLALLNHRFMVEMSLQFAAHVATLEATTGRQIDTAFQLALNRSATDQEREILEPIADRDGMANVCRLILNLNEFVFVE